MSREKLPQNQENTPILTREKIKVTGGGEARDTKMLQAALTMLADQVQKGDGTHCFFEQVFRSGDQFDDIKQWKCNDRPESFYDFLKIKKVSDIVPDYADNDAIFANLSADDIQKKIHGSLKKGEIEKTLRQFFLDWLAKNNVQLSEQTKDAITAGKLNINHFGLSILFIGKFLENVIDYHNDANRPSHCDFNLSKNEKTGITFSAQDGKLVFTQNEPILFMVENDAKKQFAVPENANTAAISILDGDTFTVDPLTIASPAINTLLQSEDPQKDYAAQCALMQELEYSDNEIRAVFQGICEEHLGNKQGLESIYDGAERNLNLEKCIAKYNELQNNADFPEEWRAEFAKAVVTQMAVGDNAQCIDNYKYLVEQGCPQEILDAFVEVFKAKKDVLNFKQFLILQNAPMILISQFEASKGQNLFFTQVHDGKYTRTRLHDQVKNNPVVIESRKILEKHSVQYFPDRMSEVSKLETLFISKQTEQDTFDRWVGLQNRAQNSTKKSNTAQLAIPAPANAVQLLQQAKSDRKNASLARLDWIIASLNAKKTEYDQRSEEKESDLKTKKEEANAVLEFVKKLQNAINQGQSITTIDDPLPELDKSGGRFSDMRKIHKEIKKFIDAAQKDKISLTKKEWDKAKPDAKLAEKFYVFDAVSNETKSNKLKCILAELKFREANYESRKLKGEEYGGFFARILKNPARSATAKLEATRKLIAEIKEKDGKYVVKDDVDLAAFDDKAMKDGGLGKLYKEVLAVKQWQPTSTKTSQRTPRDSRRAAPISPIIASPISSDKKNALSPLSDFSAQKDKIKELLCENRKKRVGGNELDKAIISFDNTLLDQHITEIKKAENAQQLKKTVQTICTSSGLYNEDILGDIKKVITPGKQDHGSPAAAAAAAASDSSAVREKSQDNKPSAEAEGHFYSESRAAASGPGTPPAPPNIPISLAIAAGKQKENFDDLKSRIVRCVVDDAPQKDFNKMVDEINSRDPNTMFEILSDVLRQYEISKDRKEQLESILKSIVKHPDFKSAAPAAKAGPSADERNAKQVSSPPPANVIAHKITPIVMSQVKQSSDQFQSLQQDICNILNKLSKTNQRFHKMAKEINNCSNINEMYDKLKEKFEKRLPKLSQEYRDRLASCISTIKEHPDFKPGAAPAAQSGPKPIDKSL